MSIATAGATARPSLKHAIVATLIMLGTLATAWGLTPKEYWFDELGRPNLEQIVPKQFGDWVASDEAPVLLVNPELSETIRVIYSQTLNRTYVNRSSGRTVMLSIALGVDQAKKTELHSPEACYRTQGFTVDSFRYDTLDSPAGPIKLTRLATHAQARKEPVSYWIRMGQRNVRGPLEMNFSRFELAARGYIADGVLFRVSEISDRTEASFRLQDQFMNDLISEMPTVNRAALIGAVGA